MVKNQHWILIWQKTRLIWVPASQIQRHNDCDWKTKNKKQKTKNKKQTKKISKTPLPSCKSWRKKREHWKIIKKRKSHLHIWVAYSSYFFISNIFFNVSCLYTNYTHHSTSLFLKIRTNFAHPKICIFLKIVRNRWFYMSQKNDFG